MEGESEGERKIERDMLDREKYSDGDIMSGKCIHLSLTSLVTTIAAVTSIAGWLERERYQDSYYVVIIMKQIEGKLIQVMDRHVGCTCSGNTV